MQTDMHYYGTYAMARAAGLKADVCQRIAYSAQFVDDNAGHGEARFDDAGGIDFEATAHHKYDVENLEERDQRHVWVPFHFLPGNEGGSFTERLICRKNSPIAQEMVTHHLSRADAPYAVELLGITAHVYADTFAHYGFSGVSSRHNRVVNDSWVFHDLNPNTEKYILDKAERHKEKYWAQVGGLMKNIKSWGAEIISGALGHGAVLTFPDRPYLVWEFEYEYPEKQKVRHHNPSTFVEGCEALHTMFRKFAMSRSDLVENDGKQFEGVRDQVSRIIGTQGDKSARITAWRDAAKSGTLFASGEEDIPSYESSLWLDELKKMKDMDDSSYALNASVFRFFQAASFHRHYVLRELLPKHGLAVA